MSETLQDSITLDDAAPKSLNTATAPDSKHEPLLSMEAHPGVPTAESTKERALEKSPEPHTGSNTEEKTTTDKTVVANKLDVNTTNISNAGASINTHSGNEATENIAAILKLLGLGKLTPQEVQAVRGLVKEHAALKVKVDRLKGLLGRSAKAQREAKVELEVTQKRLDQALRDVQRLKDKVDHLSTRPTHSTLSLGDFFPRYVSEGCGFVAIRHFPFLFHFVYFSSAEVIVVHLRRIVIS